MSYTEGMPLKAPKGLKPKSAKQYETITAEKYATMLKVFIESPNLTVQEICVTAEVSRYMVKKALTEGWPKLGLPPLSEAQGSLVDPVEVHKKMSGMTMAKQEVMDKIFGPLPHELTASGEIPAEVKAEATTREAEGGMAARIALGAATQAVRAAEVMGQMMLEKIAKGEVEMPDEIRPEHVYMLAKSVDVANSAVHRAIQVERARLGQPSDMAGQHIAAVMVGATVEELKYIAATGQLPPRIMGTADPALKAKAIEVQAVEK